MLIIFDKRTGSLVYTIDNETNVEELNLPVIYGIIALEEIIKLNDYYIDLNTFNLTKKNEIFLNFINNILYMNSLDLTVKNVVLTIENIDGLKYIEIPMISGVCSIPIIIANDKVTRFSVFSVDTKSEVLEINNDKEILDLDIGLVL